MFSWWIWFTRDAAQWGLIQPPHLLSSALTAEVMEASPPLLSKQQTWQTRHLLAKYDAFTKKTCTLQLFSRSAVFSKPRPHWSNHIWRIWFKSLWLTKPHKHFPFHLEKASHKWIYGRSATLRKQLAAAAEESFQATLSKKTTTQKRWTLQNSGKQGKPHLCSTPCRYSDCVRVHW